MKYLLFFLQNHMRDNTLDRVECIFITPEVYCELQAQQFYNIETSYTVMGVPVKVESNHYLTNFYGFRVVYRS